MRTMIQCMHESNYYNLAFPSKEKELQVLCDSLGIANTAKTEIKISAVHNDERLSALLFEQTVNLDQLNFLMKRLDSFDQKELATFYAAAYAEKTKTTRFLGTARFLGTVLFDWQFIFYINQKEPSRKFLSQSKRTVP
ncbi:hypothetical protein [Sedimentibacter sp. MB31-C6]|uniref:hypothetical protein n=1 Tax=Sedimentibacter sp. MB31-C6 TaxID=3109366 RepID=UPI002DDCE8FC|nr:hypothetical protein [Sedimentibacter sp. MB36-C1]WSI03459.1 hypothetical protein U8307_10405 [Sedimentibacter sp. MB36-C1]